VTPLPSHHVFDPPERFLVEAVGEPGERAFFLRAGGDGDAVAVGVEKEEVAALAEGLEVLLAEVRRAGVAPVGDDSAAGELAAPLNVPIEPAFVVDRLTLAWDGESVIVEAAATAPARVADDEGLDDDDDRLPEDVADEAAVLAELDIDFDDVEIPEEFGERDEPIALLRVRLSAAQAAAFTRQARDAVRGGRRPCPLCGEPAGPQGHFCARLN
jgi:uncharacterized repeat protein (TIGR03847 family)